MDENRASPHHHGAAVKAEVAIIGGGLAGLALARRCDQSGIDFQLFEARNRFGGRIAALQMPAGAVDLGPSWFWPGQPRMAALLNALGLTAFPQYAKGDQCFEDETGRVHRSMGFASMEGSLRIQGGVVRLIEGLVASLPAARLHSGARVVQIDQHNGTILADGQICAAQHFVLAVPPRIAARVTFTPALRQDQIDCLERVPTWMASHAKFVAVYDTPFWRDAGLSGDAMSRRGPLAEIHDASGLDGTPAALFGFVGLPPKQRMQCEDEIKTGALQQLARIFGTEALTPSATALQDWAFQPETATDRDLVPPRAHPNYGLSVSLSGIWDSRLHFASTETAPQMGGYMEGALAAADRVATDMAGSLNSLPWSTGSKNR
jgi:monoamine oxidase